MAMTPSRPTLANTETFMRLRRQLQDCEIALLQLNSDFIHMENCIARASGAHLDLLNQLNNEKERIFAQIQHYDSEARRLIEEMRRT
ncbi:unnamed protein product [Caenorhabditis bovis]|uniref:Uncharacterized protein n=1 Tax=Caenorhabditis bovis TaxID=2654633 RepID=A0A8S1FDQ8_9PELO|nr:unnamed protein product [Caenorhabditis bovis]